MAWRQVASGSVLELPWLEQYEDRITEGSRALLELNLRWAISASQAATIENELKQAGVTEASVEVGSPKLKIYWRKGFPWLAVILAIILASIILAALIVSWRLYEDVPEALQPAVIIGVLIVVALIAVSSGKKLLA